MQSRRRTSGVKPRSTILAVFLMAAVAGLGCSQASPDSISAARRLAQPGGSLGLLASADDDGQDQPSTERSTRQESSKQKPAKKKAGKDKASKTKKEKAPPEPTDRDKTGDDKPEAGANATPRGDNPAGPGPGPDAPQPPPLKPGLSVNDPKAFQGYTLITPMTSTKTYLIDMEGKVVHQWESQFQPAMTAYLLEDGTLLRACAVQNKPQDFGGPGAGGRIQKFDWSGELIWDFEYKHDTQFPHHDVTALPNGNVLVIAWDKKTPEEAKAAGRSPKAAGDRPMLPDCLLEIKQTGKTSGEVVWEWHAWDHLIQDLDKDVANFGELSEHPELIDINFGEDIVAPMLAQQGGADRLRGIGYIGGGGQGPGPGGRGGMSADWMHTNAVAYNPELDQIVLSIHGFSEVWIIDHGTTTEEAASHTGGRRGKGGDLLYRWGNPRAYRCGINTDQRLFSQHSAHWIPNGLPGAGNLLVFNNGNRRPDGNYSTVDELVLPLQSDGTYAHETGSPYGPEKAEWSYAAPNKQEFFSMLISGAQRLPNGDTLICSGITGTVFEVSADDEVVWKYVNPVKGSGFPGGGPGMGFFQPPQFGQVVPAFMQDFLKMSDEQKAQLAELQKEVDAKLDALLTDEQRKQVKEFQANAGRGFGFGGFGGGRPGGRGPGGPGGPGGGPGGPGGPGGGPGGFAGFGPPAPGSSLFRCYRYGADYAGLAGKDLQPGKSLEEMEANPAPVPPNRQEPKVGEGEADKNATDSTAEESTAEESPASDVEEVPADDKVDAESQDDANR